MDKVDMIKLNEELNCTGYARNKVKQIGHEIADLMGKIELASGMVEEGLLSEEVYKNYVTRQKKEIKDMVYETYRYLTLDSVECQFDFEFVKTDKK